MFKQNQTTVKIVFKNLPLKKHDMAEPAAIAALAAGKQGKFWEYHDLLFAEKQITQESIGKIAQELELNKEKFEQDLLSAELKSQVRNDMIEANKIGVTGTPTVFVNGRKLTQRSLAGFQALIDDELKKNK